MESIDAFRYIKASMMEKVSGLGKRDWVAEKTKEGRVTQRNYIYELGDSENVRRGCRIGQRKRTCEREINEEMVNGL